MSYPQLQGILGYPNVGCIQRVVVAITPCKLEDITYNTQQASGRQTWGGGVTFWSHPDDMARAYTTLCQHRLYVSHIMCCQSVCGASFS